MIEGSHLAAVGSTEPSAPAAERLRSIAPSSRRRSQNPDLPALVGHNDDSGASIEIRNQAIRISAET
jgi:hypothetical protein